MSASLGERLCTVLISHESSLIKESDFQEKLESKDDSAKIFALKAIIAGILNGETYPKLLMTVIKYCLHTDNNIIKKLLLLYWEVVDKKNKDGILLHEMILVCNAMKNNLTHPNEFIRGSTLRFMCSIKDIEILESLIPSITDNLQHRHSYVRKNAVLTVYSVYACHSELIPDAAELIEQFLYAETNPSAKRNAFLMLYQCDLDRAVNYLNSVLTTLTTLGEPIQLVALEVMRKVCRQNPQLKAQYIRCIFNLVNSTSHAVAYEGANTLVALSAAPTAVRAAVSAYCQLLSVESDNNIKLVILQRLFALKKRNEKILQEMLMDILRTLSSPNIDIRKKTLELALELVTQRNVQDVVQVLKKELAAADSPEAVQQSKTDGYRKALVDTLHACAVKFPTAVATVIHILINYLGDDQSAAALDVIYFVREIVEEYPALRDQILTKVLESFDEIRSSDVYRVTLWILGEYATNTEVLDQAMSSLKASVGPLPLITFKPVESVDEEKRKDESVVDEQKSRIQHVEKSSASKKPTVLADGTYASQSAVTSAVDNSGTVTKSGTATSNLRALLLNGDFFLAACLGNAMTKLVLRYCSLVGFSSEEANTEIAQALLLMTSILRVGSVNNAVKQVDPDSHQRIVLCIRTLLDPQNAADAFGDASREVFAGMLREARKKAPKEKKEVEVLKQADDLITIRQLKGKMIADEDLLDDDEVDLNLAVGIKSVSKDIASKLNRVYQLTGFSDPVYCEAHLTVQSYDIVLDMLVVNQTNSILQNLAVELHTSGDLKVVERPSMHTLPANGVQRIAASIKLTSTESGIIFGNIVYDNSSGTQKTIVVLANIHMDIMDYIHPHFTSDQAFRSMWAEFEWENKVAVNTDIMELNDYLTHIVTITNMQCLTPDSTLSGECNFLAANLYARSIFNEDALLNLSVEKQKTGRVTGYIRIRSKTQGIALSLGDKITAKQRGHK